MPSSYEESVPDSTLSPAGFRCRDHPLESLTREIAARISKREGHFFYEDQRYFLDHILKNNKVWVVELDNRPVALLAMNKEFIDQLYVHPDYQHRGIGKALLNFARQLSPEHIWLYTLQINANARRFYENNGFVAEKFGISPPPESEPDVEYHWRKS